jgi:hypothetical protein
MTQEPEQRIIRLPRTTQLPSVNDLAYVLKRARDNVGAQVESTWVPPGGAKMFQLTAKVPPGGQVPVWRLFEHVGSEQKEIWTAESSQIEKVANDIGQFGGAIAAKLDQSRTGRLTAALQPVAPPGTIPSLEEEEEKPIETAHELEFLGAAGDAVQALRGQLQDPQSGLLSCSVLVKLLDYECGRFRTFGFPVSVILFQIRKAADGQILTPSAATTAGLRINLVKQKLDIAGRFEDDLYALVLPNKALEAAVTVANRVVEILMASPLDKGFDRNTLSIKCGIVSLPDHGDDMEGLLLAGKAAIAGAPERGCAAGVS